MSVIRLGLLMVLVTGCVTSKKERKQAAVEDTADDEATDTEEATPAVAAAGAPAKGTGPQVTGTDKRPKLPAPPKLSTGTTSKVADAGKKDAPATKANATATKPAVATKPVVASKRATRVPRAVNVGVLNIRDQPSTNARIIGQLTRGTVMPVTVQGKWAKLGEGQWVLAKHLGEAKTAH